MKSTNNVSWWAIKTLTSIRIGQARAKLKTAAPSLASVVKLAVVVIQLGTMLAAPGADRQCEKQAKGAVHARFQVSSTLKWARGYRSVLGVPGKSVKRIFAHPRIGWLVRRPGAKRDDAKL